MNSYKILLCIALSLICTNAQAYTLSFDDIPVRNDFSGYYSQYGIMFHPGFEIANYSASSWGQPHSGDNVLIWTGTRYRARIEFGEVDRYTVSSFGAYFSTDVGSVLKITAYRVSTDNPLDSVIIGDTNLASKNVYVELKSAAGDIDFIDIDGVYSSAARLGFCADDMTIVPVPEPGSLLTISAGLLGLIVAYGRKRR